jgi:hypothetical protein
MRSSTGFNKIMRRVEIDLLVCDYNSVFSFGFGGGWL